MSLVSWRPQLTLLAAPLAVGVLVASVAVADGAGRPRVLASEWRGAGDLAAQRAYASATVLADGTVLIVGGLDGEARDRTNRRAELYEPLAGASIRLPDPAVGRVHHTATRTGELVVVTGGVEFTESGAVQALRQTEVFDTRTRTWRTAGDLTEARSDARATVLNDGRILLTGGHDGPRLVSRTEIFDPATGRWASVAPLPLPRTQFTIATLPDGQVLVAGGLEAPGLPSATSVVYDPVKDEWRDGPRLAMERVLHADLQLADGSVLLIGGQNAAGGSVELYDPRSGTFSLLATLVETRMLAQAVALPGGGVLVTGGLSSQRDATEFAPRPSAELYDPLSGTFVPFASPAEARALGKLALLGAGVFQIGGLGRAERPTKAVEALGWR